MLLSLSSRLHHIAVFCSRVCNGYCECRTRRCFCAFFFFSSTAVGSTWWLDPCDTAHPFRRLFRWRGHTHLSYWLCFLQAMAREDSSEGTDGGHDEDEPAVVEQPTKAKAPTKRGKAKVHSSYFRTHTRQRESTGRNVGKSAHFRSGNKCCSLDHA